ncbi:hypothetical protein PN498_13250 [Oscillatoria sp. CS-180]|uniref:hypothetical protein n=1 Tax=Oscillatoria sp. CS-180 TaxID=3021720 RepID=UPI00232C6B5A|nr:hypothetical protein [Oscillatoria sp. CS-180]MDB9526960.1 hypothetical protein [Oscillatoria sp. CS-180]
MQRSTTLTVKKAMFSKQQCTFVQRAAFGLIAALLLHLILTTFPLSPSLIRIGIYGGMIVFYSVDLMYRPPTFLRRITQNRTRALLLFSGLLTISLLVSIFCMPASAQFFGDAEAFFQNSFPQASTAIPLIFNALRVIFIIYVAIALISVLQAFRQGEDWLSVARTPAVAVLVIAMGDVITGMVIGDVLPQAEQSLLLP